ncbi:hypothetical protein ASG72_09960 [Bosea sp. Leaf344]|nr:hypothetical protein ASG72_09960 [Bosea sp. Leaf344]
MNERMEARHFVLPESGRSQSRITMFGCFWMNIVAAEAMSDASKIRFSCAWYSIVLMMRR